MQRYHLWASLCLCGFLVGCGTDPQNEEANTDDSIPATENPELAKNPRSSSDGPPPAPMPEYPLNAKNFINKPAPEFVVEKWLTEEPDREGKMVLIDFWATWCGPCIRCIPKLNEHHSKYKDRLVVIGVSNESEMEVEDHFSSSLIDYAIAIDPERRMMNEFQVMGIPNVALIDPEGIVRWQGNGFLVTEELLDDMLDTYVP